MATIFVIPRRKQLFIVAWKTKNAFEWRYRTSGRRSERQREADRNRNTTKMVTENKINRKVIFGLGFFSNREKERLVLNECSAREKRRARKKSTGFHQEFLCDKH